MKGIENQYNEVALEKFKKISEIAFDIQKEYRKDFAVRPLKLGKIGPNGLVKFHIRPYSYFNGEFHESLAAALAFSDNVSFGLTDDKSEIIMTLGVSGIVTNWDEGKAEDGNEWYKSAEEIVG